MFDKKNKLDSGDSQKNENKQNDRTTSKDDKEKRRKRDTIMERFKDNGYDTGFVYHED